MKALRILFIIVVVLILLGVLLIAGGWWWLNRYVKSQNFADQVNRVASEAVGAPVTFETIRIELTKGVVAENLKIVNPRDQVVPDLLTVKKIEVNYSFSAALRGRVEFPLFLVEEPVIRIRQGEDGSLLIPAAAARSGESASAPVAESKIPPSFSLKQARLTNATFEILQPDKTVKLRLEGIQTDADLTDPYSTAGIPGSIKIQKVTLPGGISFTGFQTPFNYGPGRLSLSSFEASAYQGKVTGSHEQKLTGPDFAYNLHLNGEAIDINQLLTEVAGKPKTLTGKLSLKSAWLGPATDAFAISGKGTAELRNGQLIAVPLFKILSEITQIKSLLQPDFSECRAEFTVADKVVTFALFTIKSTLFDISGSGTVGFDQSLNLQIKLALSPEITRQLPQGAENRLTARADGFRVVSFGVTGTMNEPKTDLLQKLILGDQPLSPETIKQGIDTIKSLFGPKKAAPAPAAPATPVPPAAPVAPAPVVTPIPAPAAN